jgi:hypothetical protein
MELTVSTEPITPPTQPKEDEDRYIPGDPIPAPDAIESDSDSDWARFSEMPPEDEDDFPETKLSPL